MTTDFWASLIDICVSYGKTGKMLCGKKNSSKYRFTLALVVIARNNMIITPKTVNLIYIKAYFHWTCSLMHNPYPKNTHKTRNAWFIFFLCVCIQCVWIDCLEISLWLNQRFSLIRKCVRLLWLLVIDVAAATAAVGVVVDAVAAVKKK